MQERELVSDLVGDVISLGVCELLETIGTLAGEGSDLRVNACLMLEEVGECIYIAWWGRGDGQGAMARQHPDVVERHS